MRLSGIAAILNRDGGPITPERLEAMSDQLKVRGPDSRETAYHGPIGLAHTLLKTDPTQVTVPQPLTFDGEIWIVADARIDAQADLIRLLRGKNRNVDHRSVTDAELILHAYHAWGNECVEHLLGDFAFIIAHPKQNRLFCARDQLGVKPLFYAMEGGFAIVSNVLDSVRTHPAVSSELCDGFICDFLLFGWNTNTQATAFKSIHRLAPAHTAVFTRDGVKTHRYWRPEVPNEIRHRRPEEHIEGFVEVFEAAVRDRLRSDRLIVSMSGGLDSTAIAATALPILKQESPTASLHALCIVYDRIIPDRERHFASLAAEHMRLPIDFIVADDLPLYDADWDSPDFQTPEPSMRCFPASRIFNNLVKAHGCRVVLDGKGGDEALNTASQYYPRLIRDLRFGRWLADVLRHLAMLRRPPPIGLRTALFHRPLAWIRGNRKPGTEPPFPSWINPEMVRKLSLLDHWHWFWGFGDDCASSAPGGLVAIDSFLLPSSLESSDANSRGQYESRFPFLDLRVLNYCWSVPPIPFRFEKELLRRAMKNHLPGTVLKRRKQGLAGCPLLARGDRVPLTWSECLSRNTAIECYVRNDPFDTSHLNPLNSHVTWGNQRPYELATWLIHRGANHQENRSGPDKINS